MADLATRINAAGLIGGEEVTAAAMVAPPGSTLYKSYAGKGGLAGPIGQAIGSKMSEAPEGAAGRLPRKFSALAVTSARVLFVKVPTRFSKPKEILAEFLRDQVTISFDDGGKGYPSVELQFADGTSARCYCDDKKGLSKLID